MQIQLQLLAEGHSVAEDLLGLLTHLLKSMKVTNKLQAKVLSNAIRGDGCDLTPSKVNVFYGLVDVIQFSAVQLLSCIQLFATP